MKTDKQMKRSVKTGTIIFATLVTIMIFAEVLKRRNRSTQLSECSVFALGKVYRTYSSRGAMPHMVYYFTLNGSTTKNDKAVNNFDTGETWSVDMAKLAQRRLFIQVSCAKPSVHKILWNVVVPDTLSQVPDEGWKVMPDWAKIK